VRCLTGSFSLRHSPLSYHLTLWSTPCDPSIFSPVPDCEPQQQAPVSYTFWETQYWDYYCSGDHPYFWGLSSNIRVNFTWDNSCFSVIENVFGEIAPNKFSGLFTNWCTAQDVTVQHCGRARRRSGLFTVKHPESLF
jgi:hypothetical protein